MNNKTIEFLIKVNDLQKVRRYGNYPLFSESTAEHTFKLILIIDYFYKELSLDLDYMKCVEIALYHDFGEMDLGKNVDIKEGNNKETAKKKELYENEKVKELSKKYYERIEDYHSLYESNDTREAKFVKACDKIEGLIHPISVGEPIMNHELFAIYADKTMRNFRELMPIYKEIKAQLKLLYEEWGFEWKAEYDQVFLED